MSGFMGALLHAEAGHASHGFVAFLEEVLWHGFLDTLKIIGFLFLTYLLMEFIEHKAEDKTEAIIKKAGAILIFLRFILGQPNRKLLLLIINFIFAFFCLCNLTIFYYSYFLKYIYM